jgi:hypothetical protein
MKLGIMQPYFLPYIGYWQLLGAVDRFLVYDNIQYTKKGWINRNRFLQNSKDVLFTVPLKKDSEYLDVAQRFLAETYDRRKLLNQFEASYRKAPFFKDAFPLIERIVQGPQQNLFEYLHQSITQVAAYLGILTPILVSSTVAIDHSLRGEQKVLALCRELGATRYVNAIGGQELYSNANFAAHGITLQFIKTRPIRYRQFGEAFVENLSIVDVMMFNSREAISVLLREYDLVS